MNSSYAALGSIQKQLEIFMDTNSSNIINLQTALSQFVDTDIPDGMSSMGKSSVQAEIASSMLLQAADKIQKLLGLFR